MSKLIYSCTHDMNANVLMNMMHIHLFFSGAGFDGVQIHAANGYLIDEFLQGVTNHRTDEYGGSIQNRLRFMKEVIESVLEVAKPEQVWIRFSPNGAFNEMGGRQLCKY